MALLASAGRRQRDQGRSSTTSPITTYDIQRRAAFLKLQRRKGNLNALADDDMIDQALQHVRGAAARHPHHRRAVDARLQRFAKSNKMTVKQIDGIMNQAGVTKAHFKEFIRAQMALEPGCSARATAAGSAA